MAKKAKSEDESPSADEAKSGKKRGALLPAILVAAAVLGAGAMAGGFIGGASDDAQAAPSPETVETPTPLELGTVIELESVTLNLAGDGTHFLKLGVAVEMGPEVGEQPPTAPIYDIVIDLFGDYTYEELATPAVRDDTKVQLLQRLEEVYGGGIVRVYYTEFVMQ